MNYNRGMSKQIIERDALHVAELAAAGAVEILQQAIASKDEAIWVLAGGSSPMLAYQIIATKYAQAIEWSKVKLVLGDERCVPVDHNDSNWQQIDKIFFSKLPFDPNNLLRPLAEQGPHEAAKSYQLTIEKLPHTEQEIPQFDLVWLGIGEDGHTLSLFPGHQNLEIKDKLVIPVYDSPKPPPERISLTLRALGATQHCMIMICGATKSHVVHQINSGNTALPISRAATEIENGGGEVQWLLDSAAAGEVHS